MGAVEKKIISWQEFLQNERVSIQKHEFFEGEVFAMAGASRNHNQIAANLYTDVGYFLKKKTCQYFPSDMRVHIPANGLFTYPDMLIVCDKPEFLDNQFDTLLNPNVLIEILSVSTQLYDKESKFELYRSIPSFEEYLVIDSRRIKLERWKKLNGFWTLMQETTNIGDTLHIESIEFSIPLREVYEQTVGVFQ